MLRQHTRSAAKTSSSTSREVSLFDGKVVTAEELAELSAV